MQVPIRITKKYTKIKDKMVLSMQITPREPLELSVGDSIILNSQNTKSIEVKRIHSLSPVFPYPDN